MLTSLSCSFICLTFLINSIVSNIVTATVSNTYIVTFLSYHPHAHQESTLRSALLLTSLSSWRLIPRDNPAAVSFPTDFVVLETPDLSIVSILSTHPSIRRVHPQSKHLRHPSSILHPSHVTYTSTDQNKKLHPFRAGKLWQRGFTGQGVSVAVFDTGLLNDLKHFPNIATQTDWTGENTTHDHIGHGTFVAGLIAGHHPSCPGLAPDVQLHIFRVFTAAQVSYTSWFLDAFNYALHIGIDILNLSIGGPDFADNPFTEKIDELAAHGIIAVSAIGNDGPLWGSLNNPGDMMPVVGVGGIEPDGRIASFSSRGMTTHELDSTNYNSYGRVKPDIVTYARSLVGPSHRGADRCKRLSGTSVASPVVAGAIALLASTIPVSRRRMVVTPASVKRALISSAKILDGASIYEQGAGLLDIEDAYDEMMKIDSEFMTVEHSFPDGLGMHLSEKFVGPEQNSQQNQHFYRQKLQLASENRNRGHNAHAHARLQMDTLATQHINQHEEDSEIKGSENEITDLVLESFSPTKRRRLSSTTFTDTVTGPQAMFFPNYYDLSTSSCTYMWPHCAQPLYEGAMPITLNVTILNPGGLQGKISRVRFRRGENGHLLNIRITKPKRFWPWAAGLGIHLSANASPTSFKSVNAEVVLQARIVSLHEKTHSDIELPIRATIIPPPPIEKRILWDLYHSMRYPPGYVPRDSLAETKDMLDWLGDHPHTNYHQLFRELLHAGYVVDILDRPISCFGVDGANKYGAILMLDSEDVFSKNDTDIIEELVKNHGVTLVVAAEWYNMDVMKAIKFEDDNTRSWWSPVIAGGNVPALNNLLEPYGIAFGEEIYSGTIKIIGGVGGIGETMEFMNKAATKSFLFESGVGIVKFPRDGELLYASGLRRYENGHQTTKDIFTGGGAVEVPVLGLTKFGTGSILAYGDTNCIDTAYSGAKCHRFFVEAVAHAIRNCAGHERKCKRMLKDSRVMTNGIEPSSGVSNGNGNGVDDAVNRVDRKAKDLPQHLFTVFKAHSKYKLTWECGGKSEISKDSTPCGIKPVFDEDAVCEKMTGAQEDIEIWDYRTSTREIVFPQQKEASPLGSENMYYGELKDIKSFENKFDENFRERGDVGFLASHFGFGGGKRTDESRSNIRSGVNQTGDTDLFRDSNGIRLRPLSFILLGICLLFISISLRRMGNNRGQRRRRMKNRKSRLVESPSSSGLSADSPIRNRPQPHSRSHTHGRFSSGHTRSASNGFTHAYGLDHANAHSPGFGRGPSPSNSYPRLSYSSSSSIH